jgi:hypothetical protein
MLFHRQKLSSLPVVMMFRFEIRPVRVLRALAFQYRASPFPWCCASACVSLPPSSGFGETSRRDKAAFASIPATPPFPRQTVQTSKHPVLTFSAWFPPKPLP